GGDHPAGEAAAEVVAVGPHGPALLAVGESLHDQEVAPIVVVFGQAPFGIEDGFQVVGQVIGEGGGGVDAVGAGDLAVAGIVGTGLVLAQGVRADHHIAVGVVLTAGHRAGGVG